MPFDLGVGDDLGTVVLVIVALVVIVFVVIPLLLFGIELIIAGLVLAIGTIGRLLFGRPWTIEATSSSGQVLRWEVTGRRRSRKAVDDAIHALESGRDLGELSAT